MERRFDLPGDNRITGDVDAVNLCGISEAGLRPLVDRTAATVGVFVTVVGVRVSDLFEQVRAAGVQR